MTDHRISRGIGDLRETLAPLLRFFTESTWARSGRRPDGADFVAGNPHELALPGFVEALQRWAVPRDKDWYAYKMNEPEARAAVVDALRERRGIAFHPEDVHMTDGGFAGLVVSMRAVVDAGDEVIFISPPWFFYEALIMASGATPVRVTSLPPAFDLPVDAIAGAITERTRAVVVNSPNNPTGRIYPAADLERLASVLAEASEASGRPVYIVSDEAYSRILFDDQEFASPTAFYPNSFLVYTYGKTLLTPGQRLGYVVLPPTMPEREIVRDAILLAQVVTGHSFPNALLQHALADLEALSIDVKHLQGKRDRMIDVLRNLGYEVHVPEGTFYLLPRSPIPDDSAFTEMLAAENVFVLPGALVNLPGYFRISLTANDEMIERAIPGFERAMRLATAAPR